MFFVPADNPSNLLRKSKQQTFDDPDADAFERGAKAARRGLQIFANPYVSHRWRETIAWWAGWRWVTGEPELPPIAAFASETDGPLVDGVPMLDHDEEAA